MKERKNFSNFVSLKRERESDILIEIEKKIDILIERKREKKMRNE